MASSPSQNRTLSNVVASPDRQESPSPRLASTSLAAAASINFADRSRRSSGSLARGGSPRLGRMHSERRRSQVAMSLSLNDPAIPSPGELPSSDRRSSISNSYTSMSSSTLAGRPTVATGDPNHHSRAPSLGDIHNELEQEQEAHVNRMLHLIRTQQSQLDAMRAQQADRRSSHPNSALADDSETDGSRSASVSFPSVHPAIPAGQAPRIPSRHNSSATRSPALAAYLPHEPSSSHSDWPPSPLEHPRRNSFRDESAFYQAETANLTRENQMLRMRIRDLEKQLAEANTSPANTPSTPSNLVTSPHL
ncbi:uncharacterized protein AB675_9430 [Cyphellophora attinorum]|uniref:Uncharacterized protein n=1 Tax=Cyphellophora attinorum TaxID=1664694 RepID=A0A0N0NHL9_9EURO|nr:uncharacterized protein AB675_9430 [Phialophora attinorum]KPI34718.1 hypothetical protein AB675_9430 [Phialophora attinorum]